MSNYILADIKRIFQKKSYINTIGVYIGIFLFMIFVLFNPTFTKEDYLSKTYMFLGYFPLVVGLATFLSVYYDDFKSKTMQIAIGYGIPRYQIVLSKLLENIILSLICVIIIGIVIVLLPILLGFSINMQDINHLLFGLFVEALRNIGYLSIAAIPAFYTQNAVNGTIFYVLLSSRTILLLLNMILGQEFIVNLIGNFGQYLYTVQLYHIRNIFMETNTCGFAILWLILIYIICPCVVSIISFYKKELEF